MTLRRFSTSNISGSKSAKLWDGETFPGYFESIATVVAGSSGESTISFTNIPQNYAHLQLRYIGRTSTSVTDDGVTVKFNSSNAGYTYLGGHALYGNGTSALAVAGWIGSSTAGGAIGQVPGANRTSGVFGGAVVDILDYTSTNKHKTVRTLHGYDNNGSGQIHFLSFAWENTSAITSMAINVGAGAFVQYSHFALYGIRSA